MKISHNQTLFQWLEIHERDNPKNIAVQTADVSISYEELATKVRRLATGLEELGIEKGDIVGVQLPNCPEFLIAVLAIASRGAIFQTLHMPYRTSELSQLLGHSKAKAVITLGAFKGYSPADEIASIASGLPSLETIISVGAATENTVSFAELVATAAKQASITKCNSTDRYLLLYTSGTTASPKGVPHSYSGFLGNAANAAEEFGFDDQERILSFAPFTHLYGLFCLHLALAKGCTMTMVPAFNPETFVSDVKTLAPTAIYSAPAHFAPFVANGSLKSDMFSSTKLVCLSGSAVPPSLAKAVDDLLDNGGVIQLWGMSELQAGTYGRLSDPIEHRMSSAGRASPGTELRLVDEERQELPTGHEGALEVRGPSVFDGYLDNQPETEAAFADDGWFRTGDLAEFLPGGYLRLTGRTKELINRGGVKFNPADVEAILIDHQVIELCAIVPVPDPVLGERACLCVLATPGQSISLDEVKALLREKGIAKYKWPERLEFVSAMPLTPTRKIMRAKLASTIN